MPPATDLLLDPPHNLDSALMVAYRYYLFRIAGQPEVWHHVPLKKANKRTPEDIPPHWVRIVNIDAIPRMDAKQELTNAYKQDQEWRDAYAGKR